MAYKPLKAEGFQPSSTVSLMAKKGENLRDLPQLLSTESALRIENYLITAEGGLKMRKGQKTLVSIAGFDGFKSLNQDGWTSNLIVVGWGTSIGVIDIAAKTLTTVKSDFVASDQFNGVRYGDYFFVASTQDKIGRMSFTLDYDAQTANFTVGSVLTGSTSGATAVILQDVDAGATGTLTLGKISGTFQDGEVITDDGGGSADVNGTLNFTYTEIAAAPKAVRIAAVGTRLFASLASDETLIRYSEVDDLSNPSFDAWSTGVLGTQGGTIAFRNGGRINDIIGLSSIVCVFADKGVWAFRLDIIDVGGSQEKIEINEMYRVEPGGAQKALLTDKGIYYVKRGRGLFRLVGIGQDDIEFSKQEAFESVQLGTEYFEDIEFDECDISENKKENTILITCKQEATQNNYIITYNTELGAFGRFTGWNIQNFVNIDGTLYGGSSLKNTFYSLFDGYLDDGNKIWTVFEQEIQIGQLWTVKDLVKQYIWGLLSETGTDGKTNALDWSFTRVNRMGAFNKDVLVLRWCADILQSGAEGYGSAKYGSSSYGSSGSSNSTPQDNFAGFSGKLRNCMRLRTKLSGIHNAPHEIHAFSVETRQKLPIRRRNLKKVVPAN